MTNKDLTVAIDSDTATQTMVNSGSLAVGGNGVTMTVGTIDVTLNTNSSVSFNGQEGSSNSLHINMLRLIGKSYMEWSQTVQLILESKGKLRYITGQVTKLVVGIPSFKTWKSEAHLLLLGWLTPWNPQ